MGTTGEILVVNGGLVTVRRRGDVRLNEMAYALLGSRKLKAEVVRVRGDMVDMQVFENTDGLRARDEVEFSGELLSIELGPGLLGGVFDGLQNPLRELAESDGVFLKRGTYRRALDDHRTWDFSPSASEGDFLEAGDHLGTVEEGRFTHRIFTPFHLRGRWRVKRISSRGSYHLRDEIAELENEEGRIVSAGLSFRWPVRRPIQLYRERLTPARPLGTRLRIIDTFFPVARGGTYCVPGPFGAGKTVLQQLISRHAQVHIVIIAACGERAGEIVETINDFPKLKDPATGASLMERTIIVCNTSSMPVAARESSVYTAVTMAEYYRQMGLDVLLLADSTSRWAQAMRERSGRMEEIPGEEAFPAYLESSIAAFYERAGSVLLKNGEIGSLTIGGTVSPAGGNFEEPVTQATLKVVGAFHALSRERADGRRFPAIDPHDSWSRYRGALDPDDVEYALEIMRDGREIHQMMKVVGEAGTSIPDYITYLKSEFLDAVYMQQNAFDPVDAATSEERQAAVFAMLREILRMNPDLDSRAEAREFFNVLRRKFLDLNVMEWEHPGCVRIRREIQEMVSAKKKGEEQPRRSGAPARPGLDAEFSHPSFEPRGETMHIVEQDEENDA